MRKLRAEHLSWTQDMRKLFGWITSRKRKVCLGAMGMMVVSSVMPQMEMLTGNYALLKNQQHRLPWRVLSGNVWKVLLGRLPGGKLRKAKYLYSSNTHVQCKECNTYLEKDVFLCNDFVKGAPMNCHHHYHIYHDNNKEFASMMVINLI